MLRGFGARDHAVTVTSFGLLASRFLRIRFSAEALFADAVTARPHGCASGSPIPTAATSSTSAPTRSPSSMRRPAPSPSTSSCTSLPARLRLGRLGRAGHDDRGHLAGFFPFELPGELPAGYLLIGDSAADPGDQRDHPHSADAVPIELYLEQHEEADLLIPLSSHPRLRTHWIPRRGATSRPVALEERDRSDLYAWVAPESGSLKHLRARLCDEFGFLKSELHLQACWFHGRAMDTLRACAQSETEHLAPAANGTVAETDAAGIAAVCSALLTGPHPAPRSPSRR